MGDVAARAAGYGIPGLTVDGNDVLAVHEVAQTAVERARAGDGPTLIECKTYRQRSHTERVGQPDVRPQSEIEEWMAKDPITRLISQMKDGPAPVSDEEWAQIDAEVCQAINDAVAFSESSPFPDPKTVADDVFAA